jgi:hypothetical protein
MFYYSLRKYIKFTCLLALLLLLVIKSHSQTATIRYQNNIQGGATLIGNSWFYSTSGAQQQS